MRQATFPIATLAVLPLIASAPLQAQTAAEAVQLDEVVVSANRTEQPLRRTGASVTVLKAEDLQKAGDIQLAPLLARQPGVNLVQNGPLGTATLLRLRGVEPRHTALYVDGVRVDDPSGLTTEFDYGSLTTVDIGRVELLRGSQSALWGSSAIGGVLNLSSLGAEEPGRHQEVMLEAGSYGTVKGRYSFAEKTERGELSFNLSHIRSNGFSSVDTLPRTSGAERDGFRANRLSMGIKHLVTDDLTLGFSAFAQKSHVDYDDWGMDAVGNFDKRDEAGGRVFAELVLGNTTHELSATRYRIVRDIHAAFAQTDSYTGIRSTFAYQGTTEVSQALTFVYGADTSREEAQITARPGKQGVRVSGLYGQVMWAPREDLDLSFSLRNDQNSDFGSQPSARLAAAWQASEALTLRGALSTGYLAPSVNHRFGYAGWGIAPNDALTPEKSESFEIGVDYRHASGASLSVTAFAINTDDAIGYCGLPGDPWAVPCVGAIPAGFYNMYENQSGTTRRKGVEIAGKLPLGARVEANLAYAYVDAKQPSGERVLNVPRHNLTLGADVALSDRVTGTVALQTLAGRTGGMPSYAVLNAGLSYQMTPATALSLRAENLLDRDYQIVSGYGTPGRSFYLGLKHSF